MPYQLRFQGSSAVRDHFTGSGLQARLPRRREERAAMIRWLKEMPLINFTGAVTKEAPC
jgi:hypothetical protein